MNSFGFKVNISADGTQFDRTLQHINQRVSSFGSELKGKIASAFGGAAIGAFATSMMQQATRIQQASEQMDVRPEQTQAIEKIAHKHGTELEAVGMMLEKLQAARDAALNGDKGNRDLFQALGLDMSQLSTKSGAELLERIAQAWQDLSSQSPDNLIRGTRAMEQLIGTRAMGKWRAVAPDLASLNSTSDRLAAANKTVSDADVRELFDFQHEIEQLKNKGKVFAAKGFQHGLFTAAEDMLPSWLQWTKYINPFSGTEKLIDHFTGGDKPEEKPLDVPKELAMLGITANDIQSSGKTTQDWLEEYGKQFKEKLPYGLDFKPEKVPTDALLSVGNFLGNRTDSLTDVANRTNEILTDIKNILLNKFPATTTGTAPGAGGWQSFPGFVP